MMRTDGILGAALTAAVVMIMAGPASAQTWTACNPMERDCPADPALGGVYHTDFANGDDKSFFNLDAAPNLAYSPETGATFPIAVDTDSPTLASSKYIFFGKVETVLQAAPGAGIVTSVVLQSDDLDEIDFEWIGSDPDRVQSNYFGKGDTTTYDRGAFHANPGSTSGLHTYTIEWTAEAITWSINGALVRELKYADAKGGATYPQTPMQVKIGTWVAGRPGNSQGTIDWAGGLADFSQAPFLAYYKSITVTDYSNGVQGATQYRFGDRSGTWQSIIVDTHPPAVADSDKTKTVALPSTHSETAKPTEPADVATTTAAPAVGTTTTAVADTTAAPDASKPAADASEPATDAPKTTADASKPAADASKTATDAPKTSADASKPAVDASKTATGAAPGTVTDAPGTATDAPSTATDAPGTATDAPGTATDAPGTATDAPGTATDATGTATGAAPGTATDAPSTATDAPGTATDAPGTAILTNPASTAPGSSETIVSSFPHTMQTMTRTSSLPGTATPTGSALPELPVHTGAASRTGSGIAVVVGLFGMSLRLML